MMNILCEEWMDETRRTMGVFLRDVCEQMSMGACPRAYSQEHGRRLDRGRKTWTTTRHPTFTSPKSSRAYSTRWRNNATGAKGRVQGRVGGGEEREERTHASLTMHQHPPPLLDLRLYERNRRNKMLQNIRVRRIVQHDLMAHERLHHQSNHTTTTRARHLR